MNSVDPQFQSNDSASFVRGAMRTAVPVTVRASVVNRTHRVVRERAKIMQERRERDRSLMLPLLLCSGLLLLTAFAVWTGLYEYQYQAAEAIQADVAALTTAETTNHILVVMLWFVPVSIALMATIWVRRSRNNADDEAL